MAKNGVSVQMQLAKGLPLIQGDRVQLQQVVLNLILNAVEAMNSVDDAPRELSIGAERGEADEILVSVRDSGPGIDPEHIERVFDSFYTTKSSGMGLGLSICRSIVGQPPAAADANLVDLSPIPLLESIRNGDRTWEKLAPCHGVTNPDPPWKVCLEATCQCLSAGDALPLLERRNAEDRLNETRYSGTPAPEQQLLALLSIGVEK